MGWGIPAAPWYLVPDSTDFTELIQSSNLILCDIYIIVIYIIVRLIFEKCHFLDAKVNNCCWKFATVRRQNIAYFCLFVSLKLCRGYLFSNRHVQKSIFRLRNLNRFSNSPLQSHFFLFSYKSQDLTYTISFSVQFFVFQWGVSEIEAHVGAFQIIKEYEE